MKLKTIPAFLVAASVVGLLSTQLAPVSAQADSSSLVASADCSQTTLPANDDGSSTQVPLPDPINFYGQTYSSTWINNNGNVTFDGPLSTFTPFGLLSTQTPIIAPFFADVDTRNAGTDPVTYGYGDTTFQGHAALCIDWFNVGYFAEHDDKLNTFQLLLVMRPDEGAGAFDIVFNYDKVQWETGDASGGTDGLGGSPARVGFSSGTGEPGTSTELAGSGISGSFLDGSPTGLTQTRLGSDVNGRYIFPVRGAGVIADKYVALGDSFQSGEGAYDYEPGTNTDTNKCHRSENAYPHLLVNEQKVRLTLDFRACSGALMGDLFVQNATGHAPYDDNEEQIDALGPDTKLVTVGIVGNDLGFASTMQNCVLESQTIFIPVIGGWTGSCQRDFGGAISDKLKSLESGQIHNTLLNVYRIIRGRAPYARVVVVSYPDFFPQGGNSSPIGCNGIVRASDQQWINASITRADKAIGKIAAQAGFEYTNMASVMAGHEQCTDDPGLNGIVVGSPVAPESYHPNVLGHQLMAARVATTLDGTVEPSFVILPQQTVTRSVTVSGNQLSVNVGWPGSDVLTTVTSPSGQIYSRTSFGSADHANGPTFEYYDITDPEPGTWTVSMYGLDVSATGEPVTFEAQDLTTANVPPTAVITSSGSGQTYSFSASHSTDSDGTIVGYEWDFGDGTTGTGATANHTFATPGSYDVTLVTTDNDGDQGFADVNNNIVVPQPSSAPALFSATATTLTNQFTLGGNDANVYVSGNYACNSNVRINGSVTATGNVYLTNKCHIDGDVVAGGNVAMDSAPYVGGGVTAGGTIAFQSTGHVTGNLTAAGTITITDGKSLAYLHSAGALGGDVRANTPEASLPEVGYHPATYDPTAFAGLTPTTWTAFMNSTAVTNSAPSWSAGLTSRPGCTMAPYSSSVNGPTASVTSPTLLDARSATSGCNSVAFQGMTLKLSADLVIFADSISTINGMTVQSADGQPHILRLLVPGSSVTCSSSSGVTLSSETTIDPLVATEITAPGKVTINGASSFSGRIQSGCFSSSGTVAVAFAPVAR